MMKLYSVVLGFPLGKWDGFRFEPLHLAQRFRKWQIVQALKLQIAKERQELATLPDYILKDIGVSAGDAWLESQRSIDDLPAYRVRKALRDDYRAR